MVSALVHDVDHMGLNNSFHFKVETPMGILSSASGNTSVLEVHHCNVAIQILQEDSTNVFHGLTEDEGTSAYKLMIECILATDMGKHKELCTSFVETFPDGLPHGRVLNENERLLLMQMTLKSADISNVVKPFEVARQWALAVTEEFHQQGDREKQKGVEVLPMFDRSSNVALAKGQVGFIDYVGVPHFKTMAQVVPGFASPWLTNLDTNRKLWTEYSSEVMTPK
jgi:cAMP-specific phosphodiesterase